MNLSLEVYRQNQENPEQNPVQAVKKLKQMQYNIQMMKNRFKVLQGKEDYHRYKTIDQGKRIALHQSIHEKIQKQKFQLKKSMQNILDNTSLREKFIKNRQETKKKLTEVRQKLLQQKRQRSQQRNEEYQKNLKRLKWIKDSVQLQNRLKKQKIAKEQQRIKQNCKKYLQNKIKGAMAKKSKENSHLNEQSHTLSQQIEMMQQLQKDFKEKYKKNQFSDQNMQQNKITTMNSQKSQGYHLPSITPSINDTKTFIT